MPDTQMTEHDDDLKPISLRDVDPKVWKDFKRLAAIHDKTLQDFLKYLVEKEKTDVRLDIKP